VSSPLDVLVSTLEEQGWSLLPVPGQSAVGGAVKGQNGTWSWFASGLEDEGRLVFYSVYPTNVPPDRRPAVAELLTRVNYASALGNFEMDFDDGEVRYRTSIEVPDAVATSALLAPIAYANIAAADRFLPAFQQVLEAACSPEEALEAADAAV
jgi:hypothetical protein